RKALNFGHTVGHAIESHALESSAPLLHGEAIAAGMICESYLSHKQLHLPSEQLHVITQSITQLYHPKPLQKADYAHYLTLMGNDKKNEGHTINFSLLPQAGAVEVNQVCPPALIQESLDYFNEAVS
ncbi:MAG: 3-dehydroquinate synthase, partial [Bacteroidota bacterium]